jgi:hypothetical protein
VETFEELFKEKSLWRPTNTKEIHYRRLVLQLVNL